MQGQLTICSPWKIQANAYWQAMERWFNNHRVKDVNRRVLKLDRKIALRTVIGHHLSEEVNAKTLERAPDAKPGSKPYFGAYQLALSEVISEIPEEDLKKYEDIREEWQKTGPSPEIKQK